MYDKTRCKHFISLIHELFVSKNVNSLMFSKVYTENLQTEARETKIKLNQRTTDIMLDSSVLFSI